MFDSGLGTWPHPPVSPPQAQGSPEPASHTRSKQNPTKDLYSPLGCQVRIQGQATLNQNALSSHPAKTGFTQLMYGAKIEHIALVMMKACFWNTLCCCSVTQLCPTLCKPMDCNTPSTILPCPLPSPGACSNSCPLSW